jgi:hypothetical protein
MKTGIFVMIVCLALYVLLRVLFARSKDDIVNSENIYDDPEFDGLDGTSGVVGMNSDELDIEYPNK